jgi:ribosomal protein L21
VCEIEKRKVLLAGEQEMVISGTTAIEDVVVVGEFHDQGDVKWIVIRGQLRGHNDTPFGWPTPGRPISRPGVRRPKGVFLWF